MVWAISCMCVGKWVSSMGSIGRGVAFGRAPQSSLPAQACLCACRDVSSGQLLASTDVEVYLALSMELFMESATSMKQSCHDGDGSTALVHLLSRVTFNGCECEKGDGEDGLSMPKHQEIAICMHVDM